MEQTPGVDKSVDRTSVEFLLALYIHTHTYVCMCVCILFFLEPIRYELSSPFYSCCNPRHREMK